MKIQIQVELKNILNSFKSFSHLD